MINKISSVLVIKNTVRLYRLCEVLLYLWRMKYKLNYQTTIEVKTLGIEQNIQGANIRHSTKNYTRNNTRQDGREIEER